MGLRRVISQWTKEPRLGMPDPQLLAALPVHMKLTFHLCLRLTALPAYIIVILHQTGPLCSKFTHFCGRTMRMTESWQQAAVA